jgi:thymidylate kinase
MKRVDFLGVPGVGKTTTYNLLKNCRKCRNEFFLSEEAYQSIILSQSTPMIQSVNKIYSHVRSSRILRPLTDHVEKWLDFQFATKKVILEKENLEKTVQEMCAEYPDFLTLILNGVGKQSLKNSNISASVYFESILKISNQINLFKILEKSLNKEDIVIFDSSFSHKVISIVDFSKEMNRKDIDQYFRKIPIPSGVVIFNSPARIIVDRIRQRNNNGRIISWHRPIIDSDLLEEWVTKAGEIVDYSRSCLLELQIPVLDLDATKLPLDLANQVKNFILALKNSELKSNLSG